MSTFIAGKDAALEDSITLFQEKLTKLGFDIEEASWLNPVPNVWSVHIRDKHCPLCFTNGKGASKKAALASALGEFLERLSTNYFFADFYLGEKIANSEFVHYPNEKWFAIPNNNQLPNGLLDKNLLAIYNPENELQASELIDLQSSNEQRGICALPFIRQSDGQTIYIPINIIANLYVSNGMSAGNTQSEARVQALSEIFERYVKNKVIAEAISLPAIPDSVIARYPAIAEALASLEQQGLPIFCFDASLGGTYPVICVVLFNPHNGSCFASFGAHPNFSVAFERTVTELLQGRSLNDLDVFLPPTFAYDEVADHTNLETHFIDSSGLIAWDLFKNCADYPFVDWDFSGTTEQEFYTLMTLCHQLEADVYIADYNHLGVNACRILVPGISEIYPIEDLLLANNNMAIHLRQTILTLPDSHLSADDYYELFSQLDEEGFDDAARIRELLGIAPNKNDPWYNLRVGELKAMLALAAGEWQTALDWVDWTYEFNQESLTQQQGNAYRCLSTLLNLVINELSYDEYYAAFCCMYGKESVDLAWRIIQGEVRFYSLTSIDENISNLSAHHALLDVYQRLQLSKLSNQ